MIEVGSLCMKIAGREAGRLCIVVDIVDSKKVLVDGQVKRKNCNINHLESLNKVLEIKKGALHDNVVSVLKKEGIEVVEKKPKQKAVKQEVKEAKPKKKESKEIKKTKSKK